MHYARCLILPNSNFLHQQIETLYIGLQDSIIHIVNSIAIMGNSELNFGNLDVWLNYMLANKLHFVDQQSNDWNNWIVVI
jgi:hypothetical protein